MSYEKKYKDALERAKIELNADTTQGTKNVLMTVFPELQESEDEKIRKALVRFHKSTIDVDGIKGEEIVAWLEKQGKHLENYGEAEKEKADFVGDGFIKCYTDFLDFKAGYTYWLEYIGDDKYNVKSYNLLGKTYHITPYQLYTVFKKFTWIEKQGEKKSTWSEEDGTCNLK